jgi:hypothetical protein
MENAMRAATLVGSALIATFFFATWPFPASALTAQAPEQQQPAFTSGELVGAGQQFFGTVSRALASLIEKAVGQWGLPNGYALGEEAGGAFFGGLRYGEGTLYTKNAGDLKVLRLDGISAAMARGPWCSSTGCRRLKRSINDLGASAARPILLGASE